VYVQPFPGTAGEKWQISNQGEEPKWRQDGNELFYLGADQRLMAVRIRTSPRFEADRPVPLFEAPAMIGNTLGLGTRYDVAPDGQRFLFNAPVGDPSKPITVVVKWAATLPH
jgi:hypothetical protein